MFRDSSSVSYQFCLLSAGVNSKEITPNFRNIKLMYLALSTVAIPMMYFDCMETVDFLVRKIAY